MGERGEVLFIKGNDAGRPWRKPSEKNWLLPGINMTDKKGALFLA